MFLDSLTSSARDGRASGVELRIAVETNAFDVEATGFGPLQARGNVDEFDLLASAITGRRTAVRRGDVSEVAPWAYSDGQNIVMPCVESTAGDYWLAVVTQSLLIAGGSLHPTLLRRVMARNRVARRYALFEAQRVARWLCDRVPPRFQKELDRLGLNDFTSSAAVSAEWALGNRFAIEIPDFIGTIRPGAVFRNRANVGGVTAWLLPQKAATATTQEPAANSLQEDDPGESSKILRLFNNPFGGDGVVSDLMKQLLGMGSSSGHRESAGDGAGGDEMPIGRIERAWRRGARAVRAQLGAGPDGLDLKFAASLHSYPEWDMHVRQFKSDWVSLEEVAPYRPDGLNEELFAALGSPSLRLRRELLRLSQDFETHRRQRDGCDFDEGRLIEHAVDLRLGRDAPTSDVYRAGRKTRRDLGVMIVVDSSGSTAECNSQGESAFSHLCTAAFRLARGLDLLGDKVTLYGFSSWGRKLAHMVCLKGHEEAWSGRVAERVAQLDTVGFTRLGVAVRHADHKLRTQIRLPHRLMILVTDGLSYDTDYEGNYAEEDTRRALAQAHANGTACVCVCIGGSVAAENLSRIFDTAQLLMLGSVDELDARIGPACLRALQGVSRRSRKRMHGEGAKT